MTHATPGRFQVRCEGTVEEVFHDDDGFASLDVPALSDALRTSQVEPGTRVRVIVEVLD